MVVGCLYLPRQSAPGPKFDYKLRWYDRLGRHAGACLRSGAPVVSPGLQRHATDLDVYAPERWVDDALSGGGGVPYRRLVAQGGRRLRALHPDEIIYTFGVIPGRLARDAGLPSIICLLSPPLAKRLTARRGP